MPDNLDDVRQKASNLADNAKHNQTGRVDEHGTMRHRTVELCSVGAIAMLFFGVFHIRKDAVPDFKPDFSHADYGEYGRRAWYDIAVFPSSKSLTTQMSYESE